MNDSFAEWLTRLRAGDDRAARDVFDRFAHRLISLARRQFHASLKYKVDPEDVVQSAYKSFFRGFDEGKFTVGNWDGQPGRNSSFFALEKRSSWPRRCI
jgi:RNA polymerase sigma-70 factor (ECF subfamily)